MEPPAAHDARVPPPIDVVYLIGCGRSGSTVLDAALGVHPEVTSLGELDRLESVGWTGTKRCSCGEESHVCPFWYEVVGRWEARAEVTEDQFHRARRTIHSGLRLTHAFAKPATFVRSPAFPVYAQCLAALYRSIAEVSSSTVLVDSSKRAARGFLLSFMPDIRVTYVHVLRDLRGYVWSKQKRGTSALSSVPRWWWTNLVAEWVSWSPGRGVLVRHESFVSSPAAVLDQVARAVGIDAQPFQDHFSAPRPVPFGHMIGGNRIRTRGPVLIREDRDWENGMRPATRRLLALAGAPLHRHYEEADRSHVRG